MLTMWIALLYVPHGMATVADLTKQDCQRVLAIHEQANRDMGNGSWGKCVEVHSIRTTTADDTGKGDGS